MYMYALHINMTSYNNINHWPKNDTNESMAVFTDEYLWKLGAIHQSLNKREMVQNRR